MFLSIPIFKVWLVFSKVPNREIGRVLFNARHLACIYVLLQKSTKSMNKHMTDFYL